MDAIRKRAKWAPERRPGRLPSALLGVGCAALALALYLATLAPGVLYYERPLLLDSVMLQVQATVLGITGPTGEPTWVMLTHLFTYLPGEEAYLTNLASAVYASVAVLLVYVAGYLLTRRPAAAAAGAIAFGVGGTFWSQAVITEIYTMNALFIALSTVSLLVWRDRRRDRYLLVSAFLLGLSLTNHLTSGILLPAAALFVALVDRRKLLRPGLILKGAGCFALGLAPYLYLPIRASMNPPMNEADPSSFGRFMEFVSGSDLTSALWVFGPLELPGRLWLYIQHLASDFNLFVLAAAAVGLAALLAADRAAAALLGVPYLGWLFYALEYDIYDVEIYFIPTYLMLCLWASVGAGVLLGEGERLLRMAGREATLSRGVVGTLLVLAPLFGVWETFSEEDRSEDYEGRRIIETVAAEAERGSTVLHHRGAVWYLILVEGRRQDLTIADPWYPSWTRHQDIVWPRDAGLTTEYLERGEGDRSGVTLATEALAESDDPVYLIDQPAVNVVRFYRAGYRFEAVEEGVLYRLVPPDDGSYGLL